jgi:hypothetical protein
MGGACTTQGREEKHTQDFGQKNWKGRDHYEVRGTGGKISFEWILGKQGRKV